MHVFGIDLTSVVPVLGSIFGQVLHIVKKKTEEKPEDSEGSILRKWVLGRPVNTVAAALAGGGVAVGLSGPEVAVGVSALNQFLQAVVVGIAANSMVNRPGE